MGLKTNMVRSIMDGSDKVKWITMETWQITKKTMLTMIWLDKQVIDKFYIILEECL
jgi:hypothetical protein